ncbi:MAG: ABC transporter permease subunit [Armatimonadetes bacterium]|nr:ABC transporter permease subunit [Armatimonadota bacterium]
MKAVLTIAEREIRSYFTSPVGFVVLAGFLLITGFFFYVPLALEHGTLRPMVQNTTVYLTFLLPALTMRLLAEEKKTGTIEILMTSPVTEAQAVLGKFLGVCAFYVVMLVATLQFPLVLSVARATSGTPIFPGYVGIIILVGTLTTAVMAAVTPGNRPLPWVAAGFALALVIVTILAIGKLPESGPVITGYLGLFLLGASFLAVGLLCSALTRNQIVAYVVGLVLLLGMLIVDWMSDWVRRSVPWIAEVISYISVRQHLENFAKGVIDTRDIFLYVSLMVLCLALTVRAVATTRWK